MRVGGYSGFGASLQARYTTCGETGGWEVVLQKKALKLESEVRDIRLSGFTINVVLKLAGKRCNTPLNNGGVEIGVWTVKFI